MKAIKKAQSKALNKTAIVHNLADQAQAAQGNLDALNQTATETVEAVKEEVAALTAGDEEITEDYDIGPWREIRAFHAHSSVDRGFYAELMSMDNRDEQFGKGISWVHRWTKEADINYTKDHRRCVQDQSYRMATEFADITTWRVFKEQRFAATPMEMIRSIPNYQHDDGHLTERAVYPFFNSTKSSECIYHVSLRAAAMMKSKTTAEAIARLSDEGLVSLYRMITAGINIPGVEGEVIDGTMRFLRDWCLSLLEEYNDEPDNPLCFRFGDVFGPANTPLPTDTVGRKITLRLARTFEQTYFLLVAALYSALGFLALLLVYKLMAPSYLALTLTTATLLLAGSRNGLLQFVPLSISLCYVSSVLLYDGILFGILSLCGWVPTLVLSAGLARQITRFGVARSLLQLGDEQIVNSGPSICRALLSLSWKAITLLENYTRKPALLIPVATHSNAIPAPISTPSSPKSIATPSSSSTSRLLIEADILCLALAIRADYYTRQTTRALKRILPQRLCEHVNFNYIVICSVIFLVVLLSLGISRWRSAPEIDSTLPISESMYGAVECLATCAHHWATDSLTSCSCRSPLRNLGQSSLVLLKEMTGYLARAVR